MTSCHACSLCPFRPVFLSVELRTYISFSMHLPLSTHLRITMTLCVFICLCVCVSFPSLLPTSLHLVTVSFAPLSSSPCILRVCVCIAVCSRDIQGETDVRCVRVSWLLALVHLRSVYDGRLCCVVSIAYWPTSRCASYSSFIIFLPAY